jgi:hypothetical protein
MRLEGRERLIVHLADDPSSPRWIAMRPDLTAKTNWTAFSDQFRYSGSEYCPILASLSLPQEIMLRAARYRKWRASLFNRDWRRNLYFVIRLISHLLGTSGIFLASIGLPVPLVR